MNSFTVAAFVAIFAAVNASGILAPSANILQGPSSRTTLVGPEVSVISSVSPGGQIITEQNSGVVAYSAPAVAAAPVVSSYAAPAVVATRTAPLLSTYATPTVTAYSAPAYAYSAPAYAYSYPTYAYSAPAVAAYSAPLAYSSSVAATGVVGQQSVVAGPSGTIVSGRSVAAPALTTYAASAPVISAYAAPAAAAYSAPLAYSASVAATGLVGQQSVVAGPSGTIVSGRSVATPALTTYAASAPALTTYAASAPVTSAYAAPAVAAGITTSSVDTVVAGPSGTITSGKSVTTPGLVAAHSVWA